MTSQRFAYCFITLHFSCVASHVRSGHERTSLDYDARSSYLEFKHTSRSLPSYSLIFSCSICSLLADSLSGFWAQKWPAFNTWNEMETTACVINILLVNVNKHWNKSLYETKQTQGVEEAAWEHDRLVRARDLKSRDCGFESRSDHLAGVVSR